MPDPADPAGQAAVAQARQLVESALARLAELADAPVAEHLPVLDGVHRSLQDALAALDGV